MRIKFKQKQSKIVVILLGLALAMSPLALSAQSDAANTGVDDLQEKLKAQRQAIEELQKKVQAYEDKVRSKRNEALGIKSQLGVLQDNIDKTRTEIEIKRNEIMATSLAIQQTEKEIADKTEEMNVLSDRVGEFIRLLYQKGEKSYIEILLSSDAFSEYYDQIQYLKAVEEDLGTVLKKIKAVKQKMEADKKELEDKHAALENLRGDLNNKQATLEERATAKNILLETTQADEAKFQQLLKEVRAEQAQINADIVSLERALRAKLLAKGDKTLSELSGQGFIWPIDGRTITSGFHDPDYPFRRYFEHPAIDIRTKQGTPIRAIGSGYVARAHDGGMGYSYISIIHADGLSSVYGHVSCILVKEDEYVVQGQVIGCSGATPGTPGAGRLTTGPHLHLEIRSNGIPVDPVGYLP